MLDLISHITIPTGGVSLYTMQDAFEMWMLTQAMYVANGNKAKAARLLMIPRRSLNRKLKKQCPSLWVHGERGPRGRYRVISFG